MKNLLFLDCEATGVEEEDRLCQVAFKYGSDEINEFFKPPLPIKFEAMAVTHITNEQVAGCPPFEDSMTQKGLLRLNTDKYVLVAHSAKYDLGMLAKEGVLFDESICTLKIARHIDVDGKFSNHQLQYLRYYLGLEVDLGDLAPHDAFADILVLEQVFWQLASILCELEGIKHEESIERMIEISKLPSLLRICNFKKHKGKTWAEVAKVDMDYIKWFSGNDDLDEDLRYTLNYHLNGGQTSI